MTFDEWWLENDSAFARSVPWPEIQVAARCLWETAQSEAIAGQSARMPAYDNSLGWGAMIRDARKRIEDLKFSIEVFEKRLENDSAFARSGQSARMPAYDNSLGWGAMIRDARKRIEDLKFSIEVFEKRKATGEPWPEVQSIDHSEEQQR